MADVVGVVRARLKRQPKVGREERRAKLGDKLLPRVPTSIKLAAARLAKEDGVSLNQWIATAVAQKVGVVETAAEFFKRHANGLTGDGGLARILDKVPDRPPVPGDELPAGWNADTFR